MPGKIGDRIAVLKQISRFKTNRALEKGGLPEDEWVISNGLLATWEDVDVDEFVSNKLEKFLDYHKIDRRWWKTGEGDVFLTSAQKQTDNKEKMNPEEVYRNLVESNTEYRLIPKIILDQYEIIPKRELEERAEIVRVALAAKNDVIAELKKEISELRASRQVHVPAQQA